MILYFIPTEHRYVHRQADVPRGVEAEKVDVPTDLAGLMGFLNDLRAAHMLDLEKAKNMVDFSAIRPAGDPIRLDHPAPAEIPLTPTPPRALDLPESIMDAPADKFGGVLSATLERLGELRKDGWDGLRPFLKNNPAAERGIGALFAAREF